MELDTSQWILLEKPIRFQNIILPDESYFSGRNNLSVMFSNEYIETLNIIRNFALKHKQPISQKNFYLFYGRKQIGEERIAQYFQSKGYAVIQPEKYSLEDQLNIFANCENLASTVGSCSHNIVFMKNNSKIILIPRYSNLNLYQEALNKIYNQIFFI